MAEPIGLASGLLTLAGFAFQSSVTLYTTLRSFQSHSGRARDLLLELKALTEVLEPLRETIENTNDTCLTSLDLPLLRCGKACKDFEHELLKCLSRSGGSRTSFRGWAMLKYMNGDVDEFRRLLASYKQIIILALTGANLRRSTATIERIESCRDLIQNTAGQLQDRLNDINEKLQVTFKRNTETASDPSAEDVSVLEEERLSTERCIQICSQLSDRISHMQLAARQELGSESICGKMTYDGLQDCKRALSSTASDLESHMRSVMDRLIERSKTTMTSADDVTELARLREEWETMRRGREVYLKVSEALFENVSTIENYATGDATQYMVSTGDKTIHGINRGLGWRTRQVGGHISADALVRISDNMRDTDSHVAGGRPEASAAAPVPPSPSAPDASSKETPSNFGQRYGRGVSLVAKSATG